jgi:hypothetical protein
MPTEEEICEQVKVQLLKDICAAGGLDAVGQGKSKALHDLKNYRLHFYKQVPYSKLANWFYYWRRLDRGSFDDLLRTHNITPPPPANEPAVPFEPRSPPANEPEEMATTTGGPASRRGRGGGTNTNTNTNTNNNNVTAPAGAFRRDVNHIGTFERELAAWASWLFALNLVTHIVRLSEH